MPYILRDSPIAGQGIFATEPIARGQRVWRYEVGVSVLEHDEATLRRRLDGLSREDARDLLEHVYTWEGKVIEILDDAKVWNHDDWWQKFRDGCAKRHTIDRRKTERSGKTDL